MAAIPLADQLSELDRLIERSSALMAGYLAPEGEKMRMAKTHLARLEAARATLSRLINTHGDLPDGKDPATDSHE